MYRFETSYTIEEIKKVLDKHTHPMKFSSYQLSDLYVCKQGKKDFYLFRTGKKISSFAYAYHGKMEEKDGVTTVKGHFGYLPQVYLILSIVAILVYVIPPLSNGLHPGLRDTLIAVVLINLEIKIVELVVGHFLKARCEEVKAFMEKRLIPKRKNKKGAAAQ